MFQSGFTLFSEVLCGLSAYHLTSVGTKLLCLKEVFITVVKDDGYGRPFKGELYQPQSHILFANHSS